MTCFRNNISPDVMKFIGVMQMVKGLGLTGVTTEELLHIAVAVYLLKEKGEVLPKSNSVFFAQGARSRQVGDLQSMEYPEVHSEVSRTLR